MQDLPKYLACCAVLAGALLCPAVTAADEAGAVHAVERAIEARPIAQLSADERLRLPDTTAVIVKGHTVTLGELRAVHEARMKAAEHAAEAGLAVSAMIREQNFQRTQEGEIVSTRGGKATALALVRSKTETDFAVPSANGLTVGTVSTPKERHENPSINPGIIENHPPLPFMPLGVLIPFPKASLLKFAKDYLDFCTAAQATACLYFPVVGSWEQGNGTAANNKLGDTTENIVDPLVTDPSVCQAGGGTPGTEGCIYKYPLIQTTDFQPVNIVSDVIDCPVESIAWELSPYPEWAPTVDPHGAASVSWTFGWTWPPWLYQGQMFYNGGIPSHCVVQVYR
jgi:hypothetical protein